MTEPIIRPRLTNDDTTLESVRACILQHGATVSITVIAKHTGLSLDELTTRYGTKTELVIKAFGYEEVVAWLVKLAAGPDERDIREQLLELAHTFTHFFIENLPSMMAIWSAGPTFPADQTQANVPQRDVSPGFKARMLLSSWFGKAQAQGRLGGQDPEALAVMFMGTLYAPATRTHLGEDRINLDEYVTAYIDGIWHGIAPEDDAP